MNIFGSVILIAGINVISNKSTTITRINFIIPEHTVSRSLRPTLDATNRLIPRGGVMNPIARLTTITMPKWIGSTPNCAAIGNKIGASTIIAGVVSIKHPTISSNTLINNKIKILLSVKLMIPFVMAPGIFSIVRIFVNAVAHPMITMVVPVVLHAFPIVANISLILNSL